MPKGECEKLADHKIEYMSPAEASHVATYPYDTYVKCYGVAAAGMNDCATDTTACGGSVTVPRDTGAWVAIPQGICEQLKGGIVAQPKS